MYTISESVQAVQSLGGHGQRSVYKKCFGVEVDFSFLGVCFKVDTHSDFFILFYLVFCLFLLLFCFILFIICVSIMLV